MASKSSPAVRSVAACETSAAAIDVKVSTPLNKSVAVKPLSRQFFSAVSTLESVPLTSPAYPLNLTESVQKAMLGGGGLDSSPPESPRIHQGSPRGGFISVSSVVARLKDGEASFSSLGVDESLSKPVAATTCSNSSPAAMLSNCTDLNVMAGSHIQHSEVCANVSLDTVAGMSSTQCVSVNDEVRAATHTDDAVVVSACGVVSDSVALRSGVDVCSSAGRSTSQAVDLALPALPQNSMVAVVDDSSTVEGVSLCESHAVGEGLSSHIDAAPSCDVATLSSCDVASLPSCDVASLPASDVASFPSCDVASLPASDVASLPASDVASLPASDVASLSCTVDHSYSLVACAGNSDGSQRRENDHMQDLTSQLEHSTRDAPNVTNNLLGDVTSVFVSKGSMDLEDVLHSDRCDVMRDNGSLYEVCDVASEVTVEIVSLVNTPCVSGETKSPSGSEHDVVRSDVVCSILSLEATSDFSSVTADVNCAVAGEELKPFVETELDAPIINEVTVDSDEAHVLTIVVGCEVKPCETKDVTQHVMGTELYTDTREISSESGTSLFASTQLNVIHNSLPLQNDVENVQASTDMPMETTMGNDVYLHREATTVFASTDASLNNNRFTDEIVIESEMSSQRVLASEVRSTTAACEAPVISTDDVSHSSDALSNHFVTTESTFRPNGNEFVPELLSKSFDTKSFRRKLSDNIRRHHVSDPLSAELAHRAP